MEENRLAYKTPNYDSALEAYKRFSRYPRYTKVSPAPVKKRHINYYIIEVSESGELIVKYEGMDGRVYVQKSAFKKYLWFGVGLLVSIGFIAQILF